MQKTPCHEYRIAPELRRCCWYTILGALVLSLVFYGIARFVQNRGPADISLGLCLFALIAIAMVVALRWKLRIDQHGVSRRLLFRWDVWPWSALASGRIRKLHPFTLRDPERPWWRRKLRLDYMASADIQEAIAIVNTRYKLPPPPEIPATLTIKFGFRRSATFDRNGIHLLIRDKPHEYLWSDLREIHITRMDPLRRDFKSLVVTLPDQELELKLVTHQGGTSPTWRGATAEELNEYLVQFVPVDRIHISLPGQELTKRKHIERRLEEAKKRAREFKIIMVVLSSLYGGLLVWMAIDEGLLKAAVVMGSMLVILGSVMLSLYRSQRKEISTLTESLNHAAVTIAPNPMTNTATDQSSERADWKCFEDERGRVPPG